VEGVSVDGVVVVPVEGMSVVADGVVAVAVVGVVVALLPVLAAYALVPPTRAPAIESTATAFLMCACMFCLLRRVQFPKSRGRASDERELNLRAA
jgi:hypothetical protein